MTTHDITLTVNGTAHDLTVEGRTLLVHALRDDLGYTGTNVGCETTTCGACTVLVDDEPVKSCTLLAVGCDGSEVRTVEGLAEGDDLHPLQEAFSQEHGLQCGFCTPGMLLSSLALLAHDPEPSRDEIREALDGNLCRCTGYQNIVNAVERAAETMRTATDGGNANVNPKTNSKTSGGD